MTTSVWLAEGLNADLRQAGRRSPTAVVLVALGPLIAVTPLLLALLLDNDSGLGRIVSGHLGSIELIALVVAAIWIVAIPNASGAPRPFVGLLRLAVGVVLWIVEFFLAAATATAAEVACVLFIPMIIIGIRGCYRRADRH
ncbi:MAG: hypothetical protein M3422_17935 [Actinomycetota bacterium]|nr:hypothetical protein [Actinomycetota bacterium]